VVRALSATLGLLIGALLAGCGSDAGPEEKIAAVARDYFEASEASCSREGIAVFVGQREDVYGCVVMDVPIENRPIAHVESSSQRRCYIYTDGDAFDVTDKLSDVVAAQKASGLTVDEFPCLQ
jgi:hypothetical protein